MSGSIGGKRIRREEVQPTLDRYIERVLSKMPGFVSAQITGSYNAGTRKDHGDIDLAVHIKGTNVAQVKKAFKAHLDGLDLPEFVTGKNQGKKSQLYGAIVTCGFPIFGREDDYVQIDNIIVTNENEQRFQRQFLDLDAAKQGLVMGYMRTILHHKDADKILDHIGLVDLPKPGANQEYEFVLSSAGLSFRLVTLNADMRETNREELWRSANWDLVEYILDPLDLSKSYEELLDQVAKIVKNDNRSKRRIVGIMKSMIKVGPGEVGTPKGDGKIAAIERAETILKEECKMVSLYDYLIFEKVFGGPEIFKHNYLNDVIDTLCTKDVIRLGNNGEEIYQIPVEIQGDLKRDFDSTTIGDYKDFDKIIKKHNLKCTWTKIFKGDFSGYANGLASKNQGNAFETYYVNNFDEIYRQDLEDVLKVDLTGAQISLVGGDNTKRPLLISGKKLYLGVQNPEAIGSLLKDVVIKTEDADYNISLKSGEKVALSNIGIKELFPEKIFKEYVKTGEFIPKSKNGVDGQLLLDMFGIDGKKMAEVFNNYKGRVKRSVKDEVDVTDIVKSGCFMDFLDTVVGCGYVMVHKIRNKIHIHDIRTLSDMKKFIGNLQHAKVLYPNDGGAKRIDVIIETTGLKLDFEIRSKHGQIYPDQVICGYHVK